MRRPLLPPVQGMGRMAQVRRSWRRVGAQCWSGWGTAPMALRRMWIACRAQEARLRLRVLTSWVVVKLAQALAAGLAGRSSEPKAV